MKKEVIYTLKSPYRDDMRITGYSFGKGEKTACIVGAIRGNEIQQLYTCSQLIKTLTKLEKKNSITKNCEILIIPCVNPHSINIGKRFWAMDNTDINRMFPGKKNGETTERIANGVFEKVQGYTYGIQFTSFYMPGDFIPHIRMMETGHHSPSLANLFGLQYVVVRKPRPYDTMTLNYNWQLWNTNAFSLYTNATDQIDEESAKHAVVAVLRFLTRMGVIKYNSHSGYIASVLQEEDLFSLKTSASGIYRRLRKPGDSVERGDVIGEIIHPYEGEVISQIISPTDGIIFFAHTSPMIMENVVAYKIIRRLHQ
ncbi:M14 family metallopeptidase [Clostridium neonatale]|uniref:M14 family metallopeptidase n=1 Tax=Clostridium neonatale TaxID=137838 RepID=UPI00291BB40C|nr:M14 family metallopeptidase [Clostridium neonatale]CAI3194245.1 putative succinylglutamate desuccinylase/aspartoacylase [Clostridium neonatale]CAI3209285.1 putative succinylglutamate desuccinylase/aspartoacylase [Clostridium neonatale]CAI3597919.1 putative succinylglutamate desuccinylase/aspartoacylase [Clostridium neonatale]